MHIMISSSTTFFRIRGDVDCRPSVCARGVDAERGCDTLCDMGELGARETCGVVL